MTLDCDVSWKLYNSMTVMKDTLNELLSTVVGVQ